MCCRKEKHIAKYPPHQERHGLHIRLSSRFRVHFLGSVQGLICLPEIHQANSETESRACSSSLFQLLEGRPHRQGESYQEEHFLRIVAKLELAGVIGKTLLQAFRKTYWDGRSLHASELRWRLWSGAEDA